MGFLSKIYERRGKGRRQSGVPVSAEKPSAPSEPAPSPAPAPTRRVTRRGGAGSDVSAGASARAADADVAAPDPPDVPADAPDLPNGVPKKPDPFDFDASLDATVGPEEDEAPRPSARSPARRSPGSSRRSPLAGASRSTKSPGEGAFGAARAFIPAPGETTPDPFGATPSKRRRVTFAEVDAYSLGEDDDDDEPDDPAKAAEAHAMEAEPAMAPDAMEPDPAPSSPPPTSFGVFCGAFPTTTGAAASAAAAAAAPSPEWAKRAPSASTSRSPSRSPAVRSPPTASVSASVSVRSPAHSPGAALAAAMGDGSPSPLRGRFAAATAVSGDALADVDEAQYALGGLAPDQPAAGRVASAATLVALAAEPRRRRALAAHGLAPRVLRAALDLGRSVVDGDRGRRGGVIEAALGPDPETTRLAAAALLYLSGVDLPAEETVKAYVDRDLATILAGLLTPSGRAANENGAGPAAAGSTAASGVRGGGFEAALAGGADARAERSIRAALKGLKFLPEEELDARTLALLAAHRALARGEKAAAAATARDAARRAARGANRDRDRDRMDRDEDEGADHDADEGADQDQEGADEAAIREWSELKTSLAERGVMLAVARLADAAAREIHDLGEACFSRPGPGPADPDDGSDTTGRHPDPGGIRTGASPCASPASPAPEAARAAAEAAARDARLASRAMARLFRCARVIEAATFGCTPCASALVTGDLGRPPPRGTMVLVPMRTNEAIASPAPRGAPAGRDAAVAKGPGATPGAEDVAAVMGQIRVRGIHLSPPASPGGAGSKRAHDDEPEDEAAMLKKFRTAEALLLTPSPGAKPPRDGSRCRVGAGAAETDTAAQTDAANAGANANAIAIDVEMDAMSSPPPAGARGVNGSDADTPTFNFSRVAAAVDASIAWLADDADADDSGAGAGGPPGTSRPARWTLVHSLLRALPTLAAAAATATHATDAGATILGVRTARASGLGADPRLAAGTLRAVVCVLTNLTNENPEGCAAVRATGGLETAAALVPWCASLEGLIPGTGPSREAAERAAARAGAARRDPPRGLGPAAAARRAREEAANPAGAGHDMLNSALCLLVNIAELDGDSCRTLRTLEADAGALEERARSGSAGTATGTGTGTGAGAGAGGRRENTRAAAAKKKKAAATQVALASRPLGLVELLAQIFVRSGGAGRLDDGDGGREPGEGPGDGEVTAEMLDARDKESDGLITQAYAALLTAFLIEGQPALRADVVCTLPEGGLASMASVLERFRAFHENLESISEESRASLTRVIRWLRGGN